MPLVFTLFTISITILAITHALALAFSLYWIYLWFDIPMHFLGGATVALGYQSRFLLKRFEQRLSFGFVATLLFVGVVGVLWEVYEFLVGPLLPGYLVDTAIDIVMDLLGAVVGYVVARKIMDL